MTAAVRLVRCAVFRFLSLSGLAPSVLCAVAAVALSGCERVPDPCVDFKLACLAVTVDSGPADVRRLSLYVEDGLSTSTVPTPKKAAKAPLEYPLRFAIRFGEFDNRYAGKVTFETTAFNEDFDAIGFARTEVSIAGREKKAITIQLGEPNAPPDMIEQTPSDMATPGPADLRETPDMP